MASVRCPVLLFELVSTQSCFRKQQKGFEQPRWPSQFIRAYQERFLKKKKTTTFICKGVSIVYRTVNILKCTHKRLTQTHPPMNLVSLREFAREWESNIHISMYVKKIEREREIYIYIYIFIRVYIYICVCLYYLHLKIESVQLYIYMYI